MKNYLGFYSIVLLSVCMLMIGSGCQQPGCTDPSALNFDPDAAESDGECNFPRLKLILKTVIGEEDWVDGNLYAFGDAMVQFISVDYYLQNIALVNGQGQVAETQDTVLYIDASPQQVLLGEVGVDPKSELRFFVGLDDNTNLSNNPLFLPINHPLGRKTPPMHWNQTAGYIFLRIDGIADIDSDGEFDTGITYQIGTDALRKEVRLALDETPDSDVFSVSLKFDLQKIFENVNLSEELSTETLNEPELAERIANQIPAAFTID
ncbi:MAG: MbnP family protein [Bacteroidota bacterium]